LFREEHNELIDIFSFGLILYELIFGKSLFKSKYWSNMVVENYIKSRTGPQGFLGSIDSFPSRFSEKTKLFFWIILNCCLVNIENRLTCEDLLLSFEREIWNNIESWEKFDTHQLRYSNSNIVISNLIFMKKLEEIIKKKISVIDEFPEGLQKDEYAAFKQRNGIVTDIMICQINIEKIPDEICYLQHLTTLTLQATKLKNLPNTIGDLINLNRLYLVGSDLNQLPETFGNLKSLEFLNMLFDFFFHIGIFKQVLQNIIDDVNGN